MTWPWATLKRALNRHTPRGPHGEEVTTVYDTRVPVPFGGLTRVRSGQSRVLSGAQPALSYQSPLLLRSKRRVSLSLVSSTPQCGKAAATPISQTSYSYFLTLTLPAFLP